MYCKLICTFWKYSRVFSEGSVPPVKNCSVRKPEE